MYILWHSSSLPTPWWTLKKLKCILLLVVSANEEVFGHCSLGFQQCGGFRHTLTRRKARNISRTAAYPGQVVWSYIISLIGLITAGSQDPFVFGLLSQN